MAGEAGEYDAFPLLRGGRCRRPLLLPVDRRLLAVDLSPARLRRNSYIGSSHARALNATDPANAAISWPPLEPDAHN